MKDFNKIINIEFDETNRIVHLQFNELLKFEFHIEFKEYSNYVENYVGNIASTDNRCYLVIDMHNLIIEPNMKNLYIAHAQKMYQNFLHHNGVARYGAQITRVTVKISHKEKLKQDPHLFRNKEEAYEYIYNLIKQNKTAKIEQ